MLLRLLEVCCACATVSDTGKALPDDVKVSGASSAHVSTVLADRTVFLRIRLYPFLGVFTKTLHIIPKENLSPYGFIITQPCCWCTLDLTTVQDSKHQVVSMVRTGIEDSARWPVYSWCR